MNNQAQRKPEPQKHLYHGVWEALDYDSTIMGLLATEPGNIDNVYAFIPAGSAKTEDACEVAGDIVRDPQNTWRQSLKGAQIIDLYRYTRPGANEPVPAFVYGLLCFPMDSSGEADLNADCEEPRPYCASFLKQLMDRAPETVPGGFQ